MSGGRQLEPWAQVVAMQVHLAKLVEVVEVGWVAPHDKNGICRYQTRINSSDLLD